MRQCCTVICSIVAFGSAIIIETHANTHLPRSQRSYLRFENSLPTNGRHEQTKVIDRNLIEKGDWEEDDDDFANSIPFHVQDDDATNSRGQFPTMEENESESYLERYNDGRNENSAKIKEDAAKKEEGIVYSDTAGDKESGEEQVAPLPPPPPPPLSSADKSTAVDGDGQQQQQEEEEKAEAVEKQIDAANAGQNTATIENQPVDNTADQIDATNTKLENEQLPTQEQEPLQADTIFDDLLRGFTFAAAFCALIIGIYKFCGYACVKCGACPDERVLRARWRRSRLKRKRAYGESNVVPPLDTRKWAEWSAKRGRVNGGVWDSDFNDIESNVGRDDGSEAGAIVFDNAGIEMAEWENNDDDSGSEMVLEFGEGDELEDRSHDERMFDAEDGGKGVEKEATNFFGNRGQNNVSDDTAAVKKRNASDKAEVSKKSVADEKKEENGAAILFNASFDALDPPSGETTGFAGVKPDKNVDSSLAAKEFLLEVSSDQSNLNTKHDKNRDNEENEEIDKSFVSADDRGYDEDADLLGLRSDSPPPLDLEEIEKNLVENMNNAKFY